MANVCCWKRNSIPKFNSDSDDEQDLVAVMNKVISNVCPLIVASAEHIQQKLSLAITILTTRVQIY